MYCPLVTSLFGEHLTTPIKKIDFPASTESVFEAKDIIERVR